MSALAGLPIMTGHYPHTTGRAGWGVARQSQRDLAGAPYQPPSEPESTIGRRR